VKIYAVWADQCPRPIAIYRRRYDAETFADEARMTAAHVRGPYNDSRHFTVEEHGVR
jgi:hypothetical protein